MLINTFITWHGDHHERSVLKCKRILGVLNFQRGLGQHLGTGWRLLCFVRCCDPSGIMAVPYVAGIATFNSRVSRVASYGAASWAAVGATYTKIRGIVFLVLGRTVGGVDGAGRARGAGHIICVRVIYILSHPSNPCTRMAEYQYDEYYVFRILI
jgi:hypothetical protein